MIAQTIQIIDEYRQKCPKSPIFRPLSEKRNADISQFSPEHARHPHSSSATIQKSWTHAKQEYLASEKESPASSYNFKTYTKKQHMQN
jgi:hypothetical protein